MFELSSLLTKKKPYRAFLARKGEGDEWLRTAPTSSFEILDSLKPHIALKYKYLVFPVYNAFGKDAALVFHNLVVKIHGEHLQELVLSIRRETCISIRVFHEEEHIQPKKGEAIITRVEIVMGEVLEAYFLEMETVIKAYSASMGEWIQPETLPESVA